MKSNSGKLLLASLGLSLLAALGGCATTQSTKAKSLKTTSASATSLAECQNVTVVPFTMPAKRSKYAEVGTSFAQSVEYRLSNDFGALFASVEFAQAARGVEQECVVKGDIVKYRPGSRVARAILIGLGSASFEGNVSVTNANGDVLLNAPFDKLWAWGGVLGASKGIDEMKAETAASIANTLARAKGWTGNTP